MQHTTGVAVVATQLADTDRRALSQAWYSALHLADRPGSPLNALRMRAPRTPPSAHVRSIGDAHDVSRRHVGDGGARDRGTTRDAGASGGSNGGVERRMAKSELARRIERGLTRRPPHAAAAFGVRSADGRVHLVVRADGARTRVVAVCAPPLRERVERALAQARFSLAGQGFRTEPA